MSLLGRIDQHFTVLCDHGHIKFWSIKTLGELVRETGFVNVRFERVSRLQALAKSMIAIARKP
jgi:2-polyprenyl-6-hydroxyphenyl methylase/3-demethylubiquinone-9 3-methyltransferase